MTARGRSIRIGLIPSAMAAAVVLGFTLSAGSPVAHASQEEEAMTQPTPEEAFRDTVAAIFHESRKGDFVALFHGIGVPEGFEEMVLPFFDAFWGAEARVAIIPVATLPENQQHFLAMAPDEVKADLEHAIELTLESGVEGEDGHESESVSFPILLVDGEYRILLVGPGE